ncbi:ATP-binding protein [Acetobacter fallax]|nr:ATP-binding protein [Acetobacter fallax]
MRQGGEGEFQVVLNRFSITFIVSFYVFVLYALGISSSGEAILQGALCCVSLSMASLFAVALWRSSGSSLRRCVIQFLWDMGFLAVAMRLCEAAATPLYPVFLWITLGFGLRFGAGYLVAGSVLGAAGFLIAEWPLPIWSGTGHLLGGLVTGLLIIPLYAASLTRFVSTMRWKAEEATRARTFFVAAVSHELRTPLNAILGLSTILKSERLGREQRDMVCAMHDAGLSLLGIINELLEFTRLDDARIPLRSQPFALMTVVRNVLGMVHAEARQKGLDLVCVMSPSVPARMIGDGRHLEDILRNLVSNAVKFTMSGSVLLTFGVEELTDGSLELCVAVQDTGIGISSVAQEQIFESFTQADGSVPDRFGGTGLGLAICRKLVDLHGGRLSVESVPDQGSVFRFTYRVMKGGEVVPEEWPVAVFLTHEPEGRDALSGALRALGLEVERVETVTEAGERLRWHEGRAILVTDPSSGDLAGRIVRGRSGVVPALVAHLAFVEPSRSGSAGPARKGGMVECEVLAGGDPALLRSAVSLLSDVLPQAEKKREEIRKVSGKKCRILVAEDNAVNSMVAEKILEQAGHDWRAVSDGEAALDALERERFDVVLMDVNMPLMNGIDATKMWRLEEVVYGRRTPIVALTADASSEIRERCREAGMDGFLLKPVDVGALLDVLDRYGSAEVVSDVIADEALPDAMPGGEESVVAFPASGVNRKAMRDLGDLGGAAFRADVVAEFLQDAGTTIGQMRAASEVGDVSGLPDAAHALQSAAANVGAERLVALCRRWGTSGNVGPADRVRAVEEEMVRVRAALLPYLAEAP